MGSCWQRTAGASDGGMHSPNSAAMPWLSALPRDGLDGVPAALDDAAPPRAARDDRRMSREYQYEYGYGDMERVDSSGELRSCQAEASPVPQGRGRAASAASADAYNDFDDDEDFIARAEEELDGVQEHRFNPAVSPTPPSASTIFSTSLARIELGASGSAIFFSLFIS